MAKVIGHFRVRADGAPLRSGTHRLPTADLPIPRRHAALSLMFTVWESDPGGHYFAFAAAGNGRRDAWSNELVDRGSAGRTVLIVVAGRGWTLSRDQRSAGGH